MENETDQSLSSATRENLSEKRESMKRVESRDRNICERQQAGFACLGVPEN